ncbi:hypothetical protein ABE356_000202 [Escherichia coli]|nr:hypothetical protein [Escherichia coli]
MANPFDQFDTPTKGAKAPTNQANPFDQFDETTQHEAPAATQDVYNNGTGFSGAISGAFRGVGNAASDTWDFVTNLPGKVSDTASEIKHQYDTGTLFTPEFQQSSTGGKIASLLGGAGTGAAETGRALAQLPNQVINTAGALSQSVGLGGSTNVDIYGSGALSQALKPHTEQGKIIENTTPYLVPGGAIAEGAKIHAMSVKSLSDRGIPLTAENIAQEDAKNATLLLTGGLAVKGVKGAASVASEIPGALTGRASLKTTARALGDTTENLYQGGDVEAQQAYFNQASDAQGNYTAPASTAFRGESGRGFAQAESRRGTLANRQAAAQAQTRTNLDQNLEDIAGPNGANAQEAVGEGVDYFHHAKNQEYSNALTTAQDTVEAKNVTELHMRKTKELANNYLSDKANKFSELQPRTKNFMQNVAGAKFENLHDLDDLKRAISEELSANYRAGNTKDISALNAVKERLKLETHATLKSLAPDAVQPWEKADKLFSDYIDPLGPKSKAAKIADNQNAELAANQLVGGSATARGNAANISDVMRRLQQDQRFPQGGEVAANFSAGMGNTARQRAQEAAERAAYEAEAVTPGSGDAAYERTFKKTLAQSQPVMNEIEGLGARNEAQINKGLIDAINDSSPQRVAPSNIVSSIVNTAAHHIPAIKMISEPVENALGRAGDVIALRGLREQAIRNTISKATPSELEQMQQFSKDRNAPNAKPYSAMIAASEPTQDATASPDVNGMVTITLPPQEPQQHAQAAKKSSIQEQFDPGITNLYHAFSDAETGGESDPYIRTKASEGGKPSSAFGPAQITRDLMKDFVSNHGNELTKAEKDFADRFIEQGNKFLKAKPNDPKYGYGKSGDLTSPEDRQMYDVVAQKILKSIVERNGNSFNKTVKAWRGKNDAAYARKVRNSFTKRQSWSKPATT